MPHHLRSRLDDDLRHLSDRLLAMGGVARSMIHDALEALVRRDSELARAVIARDREVDRLDTELDRLAVELIVRHQPMGSDLRYIIGVIEMVTDLERIGDEAKNICERVLLLNQEPPLKPYVDLPAMAERVEGMVGEALDCLVRRDAEGALAVIRADDAVDALQDQVQREVLTYMLDDRGAIARGLHLTFLAAHLERIGDHATNLAETTYFLVEGRNIRHTDGLRDRGAG
ncbi:MAG: phosphate transport system regulatory protein PhoU [Nitrospirae bacterium]|nr:MAG: phosphate transport system regulatory protein PhoU [Nitrospirota bacterium]